MKIFKVLFLGLLLALTSVSCGEKKTEGIISVIDLATSTPVKGATVRIFVESADVSDAGFYLCGEDDVTSEQIYTTSDAGVTDKICFKLPVVVKVSVTAGGKTGIGTLSVVREETTTAVVKIN
jgi:hypothetical protein|tara:strand:+ start:10218 stop:10586 length:369 start_codon:yes stop_codon:yes gene_type:complete